MHTASVTTTQDSTDKNKIFWNRIWIFFSWQEKKGKCDFTKILTPLLSMVINYLLSIHRCDPGYPLQQESAEAEGLVHTGTFDTNSLQILNLKLRPFKFLLAYDSAVYWEVGNKHNWSRF